MTLLVLQCLIHSYISLCHKAHKALTFSFQSLWFAVRVLTFAHDCHPAVFLSSSIILLQVVLGRPGLLFPSGHSRAVTQCSSLSFLIICPIQFHLLHLISSLVLFTPVFFCVLLNCVRWSEATLFLKSSSCTCIGNRPASLLVFS